MLFNLLSAFVHLLQPDPADRLRQAPRPAAVLRRDRRPHPHPPLHSRHPDRVRIRRGGAVRPRRHPARDARDPARRRHGADASTSPRCCCRWRTSTGRARGWSGIQITLGMASLLAATVLALRILRRGERSLEDQPRAPAPACATRSRPRAQPDGPALRRPLRRRGATPGRRRPSRSPGRGPGPTPTSLTGTPTNSGDEVEVVARRRAADRRRCGSRRSPRSKPGSSS